MKNRVLWIVVSGFASFMTLGATGAAADSYVLYDVDKYPAGGDASGRL